MANYTIQRSLLAAGDVTVTEADLNTDTNVSLVGQNYTGYGDEIATNFLQMLENFAADIAPNDNPRVPGSTAITGQLWYDTTNDVLKVFDVTWKEMAQVNQSTIESSSLRWNDTAGRYQPEERVRITEAGSMIIANASGASPAATFNQGATNFTTSFAGTTDWVVSGLSGDFTLLNGPGFSVENGGAAIALNVVGADSTWTSSGVTSMTLPSALKLQTAASTAARAGLNIPEAVAAPSAPADGDVWVTAAGAFNARLAGSTVDLAAAAGGTVTATDGAVNRLATFTTGTNIDGDANLTWNGATFNVTGAITATSFGGIPSANLVNRTAPGTLAATTFSGAVTLQDNLDLQDSDAILFGTGDDVSATFNGANFVLDGAGQFTIDNFSQVYIDGTNLEIDNITGEALTLQGNFTTTSNNVILAFRDSAGSLEASMGIESGSDSLHIRGASSGDSVVIYGSAGVSMLRTTTALIGRHSGNNDAFVTQNPTTAGNTTSLTIYDGRDVTTGAGGYDVGFNGTPAVTISGTWTIDYDDTGKFLRKSGSGAVNVVVPVNANIPVGATFLIHNDNITGALTISQSSTTLEWIDGSGAAAPTGTRTLAFNSICTVRKKDGSTWQIWGNGIS